MRSFFILLLKKVEDVLEIKRDIILSSKRSEDAVEARAIICYILRLKGYSVTQIAKLLNRSRRDINYIFTNYEKLVKNKIYLNEIIKLL
jgi:domain.